MKKKGIGQQDQGRLCIEFKIIQVNFDWNYSSEEMRLLVLYVI